MKGRRKSDEGSPADMRQDRAGARRAGMSLKRFERTAIDRKADKARMKRGRK